MVCPLRRKYVEHLIRRDLQPRQDAVDSTLNRVDVLRRLAQNLGLAYRDDGTWRPLGMRPPPATPPAPLANPAARLLRRLAQGLGLVYQDDGTARPMGMRLPPTASKPQATDSPADPPS